ncbi:MAG: sensor histidine kinase [Pseudomonadota bacterium]|jgi:two-component sensor histidine kinase
MATPNDESPERALERQAAREREVEHRVKNTLQLISSLVLLQGRRTKDEAARQALRAIQQRVAAVSVAHRHVSWESGSEQVQLAPLIREIVGDLAGSAGREGVHIDLDLEPVAVAGRQGAPLALLVSEMVGNALRHAFPQGRDGRIHVSLHRTPEGLELAVADDGVGMAEQGEGFGLTVVQLMTQQVRGQLETRQTQPGVRLAVRAPVDGEAAG